MMARDGDHLFIQIQRLDRAMGHNPVPPSYLAVVDLETIELSGAGWRERLQEECAEHGVPLLILTSLGNAREEDDESSAGESLVRALTKPLKPVLFYETVLGLLARPGQVAAEAPRERTRESQTVAAESSSLRILLAEDNTVSQNVFLLLLDRLGYRADLATNGREVVDACTGKSYDVVLMDLQMPEMDGFDATRRIRSALSSAERPFIVAMTAHALRGDRERCLAAGMDDYLSKPVQIENLKAVLERVAVTRPRAVASPKDGDSAVSVS